MQIKELLNLSWTLLPEIRHCGGVLLKPLMPEHKLSVKTNRIDAASVLERSSPRTSFHGVCADTKNEGSHR
jgi:hypothetical protein